MGIMQSGLEGLLRAEASLEQSAKRIADLPLSVSDTPQDIVDISAEAVALLVAKNAYQMNLKVIEAGSELEKATLDVLG